MPLSRWHQRSLCVALVAVALLSPGRQAIVGTNDGAAAPWAASAFYIPGVAPVSYSPGEFVQVTVNAMTSSSTLLPLPQNSLPFCMPEQVEQRNQRPTVSLGEELRGDRIETSAFQVVYRHNVQCQTMCSMVLSEGDVAKLAQAVEDDYRYNWIVDNLPSGMERLVTVFGDEGDHEDRSVLDGGVPLGFVGHEVGWDQTPSGAYLHTHFRLVLRYDYHDRIVAFIVHPSSGNEDCPSSGDGCGESGEPCQLTSSSPAGGHGGGRPSDKRLTFTYSVVWEPSNVTWSTRWEAYFDTPHDSNIHAFSAFNSCITTIIMLAAFCVLTMRLLQRRAVAGASTSVYERLPTGRGEADTPGVPLPASAADTAPAPAPEQPRGWEALHADVFRPPQRPLAFAVCVGAGMQVLSAAVVTMAFAAAGFLSAANRGGLILCCLFCFGGSGAIGGYNAVRVFRMFKSGRVESRPSRGAEDEAFAAVGMSTPRSGDSVGGRGAVSAAGVIATEARAEFTPGGGGGVGAAATAGFDSSRIGAGAVDTPSAAAAAAFGLIDDDGDLALTAAGAAYRSEYAGDRASNGPSDATAAESGAMRPSSGGAASGGSRDASSAAAAAAARPALPWRSQLLAMFGLSSSLQHLTPRAAVRSAILQGYGPVVRRAAGLIPGTPLAVFFAMQAVLYTSARVSTLAVPVRAMLQLVLVTGGVSVVMCGLGSMLAFIREPIRHPVMTSPAVRPVPMGVSTTLRGRMYSVLAYGICAFIPFGGVFIECFFVLSSVTLHRYYNAFGWGALAAFQCLISSALVAVFFTHLMLSREDHRWWWRTFLASGSCGLVMMAYCVLFLNTKLVVPAASAGGVVYCASAGLASLAVFVANGAVGYYASHLWLCKIYSQHALALPSSVLAATSAWERHFWPKAVTVMCAGFVLLVAIMMSIGDALAAIF